MTLVSACDGFACPCCVPTSSSASCGAPQLPLSLGHGASPRLRVWACGACTAPARKEYSTLGLDGITGEFASLEHIMSMFTLAVVELRAQRIRLHPWKL
ncbi:hypothetical protein VTK56DRAFT_2540 [Thermocarpiscus australiensis]